MKKGQITVFLSIALTVLLSVLLTMIEGARTAAMQIQIDCAADLAMQSIFAEYHKELFNQYDLLFIDSSYGCETGSYQNTGSHFENYLSYNLDPGKDIKGIGYRQMFELNSEAIDVAGARVATDSFGSAVKNQAVDYMKGKVGLEQIEHISNYITVTEENRLNSRDIEEELRNLNQQADSYIAKDSPIGAVWHETKVYKEMQRPFSTLELEIMNYLLKRNDKISTQMVDLRNYPSFRKDNKGFGYSPKLENINATDGIFFGEYLIEKCGNFTDYSDKMHLKYQIEYIITGTFADDLNLERALGMIFQLRCVANVISIEMDSQKKEEAEVIGTAIATLLAIPEAGEIFAQCILYIWAVAEAVFDVKELLEGERVPLIKKPSDWKLSLDGGGEDFQVKEGSGKDDNADSLGKSGGTILDGLLYEDYLRIFLALTPTPIKVVRFMDIMEMDIRKTEGNTGFRLDQCMDMIIMNITITGNGDRKFYLRRKYSYFAN